MPLLLLLERLRELSFPEDLAQLVGVLIDLADLVGLLLPLVTALGVSRPLVAEELGHFSHLSNYLNFK